jgi:hypothetical protein
MEDCCRQPWPKKFGQDQKGDSTNLVDDNYAALLVSLWANVRFAQPQNRAFDPSINGILPWALEEEMAVALLRE